MNKLQGLSHKKPGLISQLTCVKGCLDYLQIPITEAWLYGGTGFAFLISGDKHGSVGAYQTFNTEMILNLGNNLGYTVNGISALKTEADFALKQKIAWENTKRGIDQGFPCYGYHLGLPEYYVVYGYDGQGYYFDGVATDQRLYDLKPETIDILYRHQINDEIRALAIAEGIDLSQNITVYRNGDIFEIYDDRGHQFLIGGKGYIPWDEVGTLDIGLLEMYWVEPGMVSRDKDTVREALSFVLEFSKSPQKWVFQNHMAGLDAYDNYVYALQQEKPDGFGISLNIAAWKECRSFASKFLHEAKERIGGDIGIRLGEAAYLYEEIYEHFVQINKLLPFEPRIAGDMQDRERINEVISCLKKAKAAESKGLQALEGVVSALS